MGNSYFKFKQFTIHQLESAMRVNTDGVLLGAWANVEGVRKILDIGTGTGVIALMLAQRCQNAKIDAVEIDDLSAAEARHNVASSPWPNKVDVIHCAFQDFAQSVTQRYDLIVSNPPYYNQSLKSPEEKRTLTRHSDSLPYPELISGIKMLLANEGRFCGVFPYTEGNVFIALASAQGLYCTQKVSLLSKPGKKVLRLLLQFEYSKRSVSESTLCIHKANGEFSDDYKELTKEFYLAF